MNEQFALTPWRVISPRTFRVFRYMHTAEPERREMIKQTTASFRAALKERDEIMSNRDFLYD